MIIKEIVTGTLSDYDTAILDNGTQIVIKRGQNAMVGKNVEIKNGVITEIKDISVKKVK